MICRKTGGTIRARVNTFTARSPACQSIFHLTGAPSSPQVSKVSRRNYNGMNEAHLKQMHYQPPPGGC